MKKTIEEVATEVAETMTQVVPEDYVLIFVLLPQKMEKGDEVVTASVPSIVGGIDAIHEVLQTVIDITGTPEREVEFRKPERH